MASRRRAGKLGPLDIGAIRDELEPLVRSPAGQLARGVLALLAPRTAAALSELDEHLPDVVDEAAAGARALLVGEAGALDASASGAIGELLEGSRRRRRAAKR